MTYYYEDHGDIDDIRGVFTLDVGDALGTYNAESFWGVWSGEPWIGAAFDALEGEAPTLRIHAPNAGKMYFMSAVGGGPTILPGSSAIAEWEHFLAEFDAIPWLHGRIRTTPVPDNGPPVVIIAAVLAGLFLVQHRKLRPSMP